MNKYEICGDDSREDDPNHRMEKITGQVVPKIERAISDAQSLGDKTMEKVDGIIKKTEGKHEIKLDKDDLLRRAFESIVERDGFLQDNYQKEYVRLLVESIVDDVDKRGEEDLYDVLKERLSDLKERNVSVDNKEIERSVISAIEAKKGLNTESDIEEEI